MENLYPYVAYLLTKHDCVVIPGFGAFMIQNHTSYRIQGGQLFFPPARLISFNQELTYNDGLLSGLLMKKRKMDFDEANLIVSRFKDHLINELTLNKKVEIPMVGVFHKTDHQKILFTPDEQISSNAVYHGFSNFYFPFLEKDTISVENTIRIQLMDLGAAGETHETKPNIPLWQYIIRYTAAGVAATTLFFFLSTPITQSDLKPKLYSCALIPVLSKEHVKPDFNPVDSILQVENILTSEPVSPPANTAALKAQKNTSETIHPTSSRSYYIIIGSFPTPSDANKELSSIQQRDFPDAGLIVRDNRFRIFVEKFDQKSEAESFLNQFRMAYPKRKDAWLLAVKNN